MSEVQRWKDFAEDMFNSFGDVIVDAKVVSVTQGSYNEDTGSYDETITSITTKAFRTKRSRQFIEANGEDSYNYVPWMILGKPFSTWPNTNDRLVIDGVRYDIFEVEPDELGIGVYFILYTFKHD